jgi:hypothetical protein
MPPDHTVIIKANITSSQAKNSDQKNDKHLRHQIITTCGDENAMMGTKHIDPLLCFYLGAYLICTDNKHLKDKVPRGNGTLCHVLDVKFKHNVPIIKYKTIVEGKYGQSIQQMLNGWNVKTREQNWTSVTVRYTNT